MKLKDAEDVESVLAHNILDEGQVLFEEVKGKYQVWAESYYILMEEQNIAAFLQYYSSYDEDFDDYFDDYVFYALYDAESGNALFAKAATNLVQAVYGYYCSIGEAISMDEVREIPFCFVYDDGEFIKKKVLKKNNADITENEKR